MESMGLSFDPNNSVSNGQFNKASAKSSHQVPLQNKEAVRKGLEEKAALPEAFNLRLSEPETQYAIYMMEKYGEDYKAMARDKRNYYQDTPKQIQKKIQKFQKIPDLYDAYKVMKEQEVQSGNR
ncbi:NOP16 [Bugula neritina]|uniref:Nucleolar protein 16 n=1 Tax=Bugula neritina TaxID=10212 RepID=A0A7J7J6Z8_BUGNE|nr:NOP16 [Bugula neritina]